MNEWIDFCVFAIQAIVMWIAVPRNAARFTRPMLIDRNPEWAAANPARITELEQGGWWFKSLQAWALVTVAALLVVRLGWAPHFLTQAPRSAANWEMLTNANNSLMTLGCVLFVFGAWWNVRWLKRNVPLTATRQASLAPRSTDDFLPRWFQALVYSLLLLNVLARPAVDLIYPGRLHDVLAPTVFTLIMSVLLCLIALVGVTRPPNHFDRAIGPSYRRMEVHVYFAIMIALALHGLLSLFLELNGMDLSRYGAVILSVGTTAALLGFSMLTPGGRGSAGGQGQAHAA